MALCFLRLAVFSFLVLQGSPPWLSNGHGIIHSHRCSATRQGIESSILSLHAEPCSDFPEVKVISLQMDLDGRFYALEHVSI